YGVAVVSSGCRTVPIAWNTPASRSATPARRSKARVGIRLAERQGRPDAVGDEGLGQRAGNLVGGRPAGAVAGDQVPWVELLEGRDRRGDDRLEEPAGEVEAAQHGVDCRDPGEPLGVADDVDDSGVAAAGDDHQAPVAQVQDSALIVRNQRVRTPDA